MDKRTQLMTLETEVRLRGFAFYQRTLCYHLFSLEDVEMLLSVHVKLIFSLFFFSSFLFFPLLPSLLFCSSQCTSASCGGFAGGRGGRL